MVDTEVTHRFEYDFYLTSHAALLGTTRPCHYHVIMDQNNVPADVLQKFTYQCALCLWLPLMIRRVSHVSHMM